MSIVTLTRKVSFSSGHRYWRDSWSDSENRHRFGKYASRFNHGHNYVLWVSTCGSVDADTGMVVNIKDIDAVLQQRIVAQFDQRSINDEIPFFGETVPSLENLLQYFRSELSDLPVGVTLVALKLEETPLIYGEWIKENDLTTLTRVYEFAASHRLHVPTMTEGQNWELFGKCNNAAGHGHNYVVEVTVSGDIDPETGMICSITDLDDVVHREIVDRYDHKNLNEDIPEFADRVTTSEIVVQEIFNRLTSAVPAQLVRVRLFETARNVFEVSA